MSIPIEKLDDIGPDEEIGVFGGSGQWIALLTVGDLRKSPPSLSTGHERIIDLLDSLQAAVDNIQGIADGDDIPSTAIRNCARAAIDRANQYLNAQAIAPSPNGFEAGLQAALKHIEKIITLIDDENAAEPLDDAIEYARKAKAALAALPIPTAEESEWQPIETAPKDGARIRLAWSPDDWTTGEGFWRGDKWVACAGFHRGDLPNPKIEMREYYPEPTYWMPLPKLPALLATFDIKKRSGV